MGQAVGPAGWRRTLAANGLDVIGIDVPPAMLAEVRRAHPDIEFEQGHPDLRLVVVASAP